MSESSSDDEEFSESSEINSVEMHIKEEQQTPKPRGIIFVNLN